MKVLVLYSSLQPFIQNCMQSAQRFGVSFDVAVKSRDTVIPPPPLEGDAIQLLTSEEYQRLHERPDSLKQYAAVLTSGWEFRDYVHLAGLASRRGAASILLLDTPWFATWRQRLGRVYGHMHLRRCYTHVWGAGSPQACFAQKLGFSAERIRRDMIVVDTRPFAATLDGDRPRKCRRFLYVGRLSEQKGAREMAEGFERFAGGVADPAVTLTICGDSANPSLIPGGNQFQFLGPQRYADLPAIMSEHDCMLLVSRAEHWGAVVQEAAAAALPLVVSDGVYARERYAIDGYNAFACRRGDAGSIATALQRAYDCSEAEVAQMRKRSRQLATCVTPDQWASQLISMIGEIRCR